MNEYVPAHTWACCTHAWWTLGAAFKLLCFVGAAMFGLWLLAVIISARAASRRGRRNYRVGGVL